MDAEMTARTQHLLAQRTGFVLEHRHRNTSQIPDLSKKSQDISCCPKASPENFNSLQESSEVRETSAAKEDMRSLLALLIVTLALAALCCCDKGKGTSSQEGSQSAAEPCSLLPASLQSGRDTELWGEEMHHQLLHNFRSLLERESRMREGLGTEIPIFCWAFSSAGQHPLTPTSVAY